MKKWTLFAALSALLAIPGLGFAVTHYFKVKPRKFDPGHTYLVQAKWLTGIGCPTNARTATPNDSFTAWSGSYGSYTDPACPTGDSRDTKNQGLLLAKTGPSSSNFASAVAEIKDVRGKTLSELGWDLRKAGTSAEPVGSHCGAGAPRWDIGATDSSGSNRYFFLGCNSPTADTQEVGDGFVRMRWGAGAAGLMAYEPAAGFALVDITGMKIRWLQIVFDEGTDASGAPDKFGLAVLDNIDVNDVLVGKGS